MESIIKTDLYRYGGLKGYKGFIRGLMIPGFRYTFLLRKASLYKKRSPLGIVYRLLLRKYSYKYGFQIPATTKIGEGFYIGHFGNVVVNQSAIIGKNCNISQGVTIGKAYRGKLDGAPTISDKVWIGANAIVVGNIKIGSNVLIAPGSYVNFDVPDNSIVISNRCKIVESENATDGYINNLL